MAYEQTYNIRGSIKLNELSIKALYLLQLGQEDLVTIAKVLDVKYNSLYKNLYRVFNMFAYTPKNMMERINTAREIWDNLNPEILKVVELNNIELKDPWDCQLKFFSGVEDEDFDLR